MPFGKYNDNKCFKEGFDTLSSKKFETIYDLLSYVKKCYGGEGEGSGDNERDVIIGTAASFFLQGLNVAAKALLQESGIEIDKETREIFRYASLGGEILISEESYKPEEKVESFTDKFLRGIGIKPTY